ncbi:UPF0280 family protein [Rhizobium sp. L1K21]|uniref:UPF0280 family protein n=1 Tax=Rhizobium sp. L1K21 TaxID=2954933 RepID=UPI00209218F6|nr:UPF0280 family protein [Rhizobium sp. L1K21]MCO6188331.1 UPF0280 family protein [Rhizobium sp. L1K21]
MGPVARMLADQRRLHLQHGPIDLIIEAFGPEADVRRAYQQAQTAFATVLDDLVLELPLLRKPVESEPQGQIARAMWAATFPFSPEFITPMAAVAGSVADHILAAMLENNVLSRAYVNNGGDIALHLAEGAFTVGICDDPATGAAGGTVTIRPDDRIGGIATSGWRGRSFSLGIADAVTVLAQNAACADAAATMIANRVDLPGSAKIRRAPADSIQPDNDLGSRAVTTAVGDLDDGEIDTALDGGVTAAQHYLSRGLIRAAYLSLAGHRRAMPETINNHHIRGSVTNG